MNGDITVISFDAVDAGVELVRNGEINIDVQCNPDQGKYVEQIIQDMEAEAPLVPFSTTMLTSSSSLPCFFM